MKVKYRVFHDEEKEVELPYFFKLNYQRLKPTYYAIFEERKGIQVNADTGECSPTENPSAYLQFVDSKNFELCTHEDFIKAFDEAQIMLGQFVKTNINLQASICH